MEAEMCMCVCVLQSICSALHIFMRHRFANWPPTPSHYRAASRKEKLLRNLDWLHFTTTTNPFCSQWLNWVSVLARKEFR